MKRLLLTSAIVILSATTALAGTWDAPPDDPIVPPIVPPVVESAFDGFYFGATLGLPAGEAVTNPGTPGALTYDLEGTVYGAFAGYNFQNGNFVYGVELMGQMGDVEFGGIAFDLDYLVDLRGRVGYTMGDALFYVAGGYSMAQASLSGVPGATGDADGWNLGAGIEVNLSDKLFIGGEYIMRDLNGSYGATPVDARINTFQVRIGMRF